MNFFKRLLINWKTTIAGIVVAFNVIFEELFLLVDTNALTNPSWEVVIAQLSIAVGLILSRDFDKSSEASGLKENPANAPPVN